MKRIKNLFFRFRHGFRGVPVTIQGRRIRLDESLRRWDPEVERPVQEVIIAQLRPGDLFVDVGANFGLHTLLGAKVVGPGGLVCAFEPIPANHALLMRNLVLNSVQDYVRVRQLAISDKAGHLDMVCEEDGLALSASLEASDAKAGRRTRVDVATLDECLGHEPRNPRLIKIDVEGAEHDVLRGARSLLREKRPLLLIEVHEFALPRFGSSADALRKFLAEFGYGEQRLSETNGAQGHYYHALYSPGAAATRATP